MCKVLAITNMRNVKVSSKLIDAVKTVLCNTEKDGFGYAVYEEKNGLFGERGVDPSKFKMKIQINPEGRKTWDLPFIEKHQDEFGKFQSAGNKMLIAHGRTSTNSLGLDNTHPFVENGYALVHNGIVDDCGGEMTKELKTDCDTEILFRYFMRGIREVEENVTGYYAFLSITPEGYLHVVRDGIAPLYLAYVRPIDAFVICTTSSGIESLCKLMQWRCEDPQELLENYRVIFDGNAVLEHVELERSAYAIESMYAIDNAQVAKTGLQVVNGGYIPSDSSVSTRAGVNGKYDYDDYDYYGRRSFQGLQESKHDYQSLSGFDVDDTDMEDLCSLVNRKA